MTTPGPRPPDLQRTIGFWGASAVMVGIVIGSGIFRTPGEIAQHSGNALLILGLWVVGGVLSLFGAFTYAELAVLHPESGGVYVFLREGYGRAIAFVFGWSYLLLAKPFAAAGIAIIFAGQFNERFLGYAAGDPVANAVTTSIVLVVLTAINAMGLRLGSGVAGVLTSIKVAALIGIVVLAVAMGRGDAANFTPVEHGTGWLLALAPIMASVLWTFDGWSDVGAIAGEVREPGRQIPRIYVVGTVFLIGLYTAVNAVYIWMIPLTAMRGTDYVATPVMEALIGPAGGTLIALVVIIATIGSTHGAIITGARVTYAQARDGLLFRGLGRVSPRFGTPAVSLWVQCALSCAAVWYYGRFEQLAGGFVFTMWIFYGLAGSVIFIERRRRPGAARAYRCWGYPVIPAIFVLSAAAMTVLTIYDNPGDTWKWLVGLAGGFPVYFVWDRWTRPRPEASTIAS
ncbi:MAG: amino acid permease [Phycisphaerales bacterium]|nr:amino acid permease [Phycisphaerales bacterium]